MKETEKGRIMDPLKGYKTIIHLVAESWKSLCLSCDLGGIFILLSISICVSSIYLHIYLCLHRQQDLPALRRVENEKGSWVIKSRRVVGSGRVSEREVTLTCVSIFLCMCLPLEVLNRPDEDKGEADIWIHSEQILCQGCGIRGMAKGCWCGKLWIMRVVEAGGLINGDKVKIPMELEGQYSVSTQVVKPWDRKLTW